MKEEKELKTIQQEVILISVSFRHMSRTMARLLLLSYRRFSNNLVL